MSPDRLLLTFERAPGELRLTGADEAVRALTRDGARVEPAARRRGDPGVVGALLRFWFPYLWSAGVAGVSPAGGVGSAAETGAFVVTLPSGLEPALAPLSDWLQARPGRRLRASFGGLDMEARTPAELHAAWARLTPESARRAP